VPDWTAVCWTGVSEAVASKAMASEGSVSEGSVPEGSVPEGSVPEGSVSRVVARRRRRRTTSTGSARKATRMSRPTATSTVVSHRGMPVAAGAVVGSGPGWRRGLADDDRGWAGGCCRWRTRPGLGGVGAAGRGIVSTVPEWMTSGSGPTACRLAAYSAGQPPRTANSAAMPDSVSPAATV
jgi:hypothetical protein